MEPAVAVGISEPNQITFDRSSRVYTGIDRKLRRNTAKGVAVWQAEGKGAVGSGGRVSPRMKSHGWEPTENLSESEARLGVETGGNTGKWRDHRQDTSRDEPPKTE